MRNLKRVLTMVMAVAMMMSLLVVGAGAAFKDQDKIENTDAVNMNVALNIINGRDDGTFDPAGNVTRAEMAKMICVLLNGGNEPQLPTKPTPVFTDIKGHWGEKYIEYCASLGIIAGMGDGTFVPDGNVTGTQAAKMLLVAMGYDAAFEGFNGASWSVKIGVAANQKNLYDELGVIDPNAALIRDDAAQMVWNALQAKEVKYTYSLTTVNGQLQNVQIREDKNTTLLETKYKTLDTAVTNGVLTGISYNSTSKKFTYTLTNADNKKGGQFTTKADFTKLFGHNVTAVAKTNSDVYGMYADDSAVIFSGLVGDIDFANATIAKGAKVEFNDKDYNLAKTNGAITAQTVIFNDMDSAATVTNTAPGKAFFQATAIDNTNDGKIDLIVYYPVSWGEVTYVGKDYVRVDGARYDFEDYKIFEGIAKEDYALIDNNGLVDDVITQIKPTTAKLTAISGDTVTFEGTKYDQSLLTSKLTSDNLNKKIEFVAINGYLVKQDAASSNVNFDEMVLTATTGVSNANGGWDVKAYFTDGTSKVISVKGSQPAANTVYSFEITKGEYELTALSSSEKLGFDVADQDAAGLAGVWTGKAAVGGNADYATIDSNRIADNAIVLVKDGTSYSLITGAKLAKITGDMTVYAYGVEKNDTTGYNYVTFAVVSGSTVATSDLSYGYITSDVDTTKNADKETVYSFKMWNGSKEVSVSTIGNPKVTGTLAKGAVVSYTLDGTAVDAITVLTGGYGAVLATDGQYVDILVDNAGKIETVKIDKDDTTILYISTADKSGDATGTIVKADKADVTTENPTPTAYAKDGTFYYANVLFVSNDLIVVDVNNDILSAQ